VKIARSLLAVAVGFGLTMGLIHLLSLWTGRAGNYSTTMNYFLASLTATIFAAMFGGYVTAFIAGSHEFPHTAAVGLLMIAMSFVSMRQSGATIPGWFETSVAGCGPLSAMIGAALRLLTKRRTPVRPRT
jgi:hypothetical protein